MKVLITIACCIILIACKSDKATVDKYWEYKKTIEELKTNADKDAFLANLVVEDQAMRISDEEQIIVAKYGFDSKEFRDFWKKVTEIDVENFRQLKLYLDIHGYTEETVLFSSEARSAFGVILAHHHEYEDQLSVLKLLVPAYKKGFMEIDPIVWILNEMHEAKYYELFDLGKNRFRVEEEFDGLVKKLELEELFE